MRLTRLFSCIGYIKTFIKNTKKCYNLNAFNEKNDKNYTRYLKARLIWNTILTNTISFEKINGIKYAFLSLLLVILPATYETAATIYLTSTTIVVESAN